MIGYPITYGDFDNHKIDLKKYEKFLTTAGKVSLVFAFVTNPAFAVDNAVTNLTNTNTTTLSKGAAAAALLALNSLEAASCAKGLKCLQEAAVQGAKNNPKALAGYLCVGAIAWCVSGSVTRAVLAAN